MLGADQYLTRFSRVVFCALIGADHSRRDGTMGFRARTRSLSPFLIMTLCGRPGCRHAVLGPRNDLQKPQQVFFGGDRASAGPPGLCFWALDLVMRLGCGCGDGILARLASLLGGPEEGLRDPGVLADELDVDEAVGLSSEQLPAPCLFLSLVVVVAGCHWRNGPRTVIWARRSFVC